MKVGIVNGPEGTNQGGALADGSRRPFQHVLASAEIQA